ncbi:hypothetical protein K6754_23820 [Vibrio alginolyticus]|uniref:hypothetical protein n=1 Tax=Vibrio alginolyticus TaxID=663 RepID=UPI001EEFD856|nr:hypothetical protein [Vibrio alginolyticus]ULF93922.1 hypothetical protein K6754_23820 [Vibrio alginolyticus]
MNLDQITKSQTELQSLLHQVRNSDFETIHELFEKLESFDAEFNQFYHIQASLNSNQKNQKKLESEITQRDKELESSKRVLTNLNEQIDKQKSLLDEQEKRIAKLNHELSKKSVSLESTEAKLETERNLVEHIEQLESVKNKFIKLLSERDNKLEAIEQKIVQAEEALRDNEDLEQRLQWYEEDDKSQSDEISKLEKELQAVSYDSEKYKKMYEARLNMFTTLQKQYFDLQQEQNEANPT